MPESFEKQAPDVEAEAMKVKKISPEDANVRMANLRKVYRVHSQKCNIAVKNLSISIKKGECFALLGINGAGKSTTFKMLTGDVNPTSGQVSIGGNCIPKDIQEARMLIGYCPQSNALLPNLTGREHLNLFATIKGIDSPTREILINQIISEMELKQYADKRAGSYSGGNKRKLMVAQAMIGNPPILLLDEPSTGMDPEAKHKMWNVIQRVSTTMKQASVILTTHTMEEAETLSRRIAILVDGELKCIGNKQELKNKFGKGFEIDIKLIEPTRDQISNMIQQAGLSSKNQIKYEQKQNVRNTINKLGGSVSMFEEIKQNGNGASIYLAVINSFSCQFLKKLNKNNFCQIGILVEYVYLESLGDKLKVIIIFLQQLIKEFIKNNFGKSAVIEHFQSYYKFKIHLNHKLSKMFGIIEKNVYFFFWLNE